MNKMEPVRNINLPPTRQLDDHKQCVFFIFLSPLTIFQSHSWYAWSCRPQSSQHWSEIKEQPSMWLHNSCSGTATKQSAVWKGMEWHDTHAGFGTAAVGHWFECIWQLMAKWCLLQLSSRQVDSLFCLCRGIAGTVGAQTVLTFKMLKCSFSKK